MERFVAGVDVGGTTIKLGLFPVGKAPVATWEVKSPPREEIGRLFEVIRDALYEKCAALGIPKEALKAVGLGFPGPIQEDGYCPRLINLGMGASYPAKEMTKLMGIPAAAVNDANAAALGEVAHGAAKGVRNAVLFTLGTGVGGGVIVDGKVLAGAHGVGGELGHFVVNPEEPEQCNCGNYGCLEQYASATGIVRTAKRILAQNDVKTTLRDVKDLTAKDVLDAAKAGDPAGLEALDVYAKALGIAVSHVVLTTDPDRIILGGGVSKAGPILAEAVGKYVDRYTHIAEKHGEIVLATLGNDAGMYGAAALAESLL